MKVLILAAGLGKRMKSKFPKVVHKLSGKEMINWVVETAGKVSNEVAVVLGHKAEVVEEVLPHWVEIFIQKEQLGTAHAVMSASSFIDPSDDVLILYGDVPLISAETIEGMMRVHRESKADVTVLTAVLEDPSGYGRIIRDENGEFIAIVEDSDLRDDQRDIKEINSGIYIFNGGKLLEALPKIRNDNAQGEYYLTDAVSMMDRVATLIVEDPVEVMGVNTRKQLALLEEVVRRRIVERLMDEGVTVIDPSTTYIHSTVRIGKDTIIHPMTFIEGKTVIGEDCEIGPMSRIVDSEIGSRVRIIRSEVYMAFIDDEVTVGPFARLREGSVLKRKVRVGNFVEVKKATLEEKVAAQHLTYIGDAHIGRGTNVGAGTITCNYDGVRKNPTFVGENVFIGSDTELVAPVRVEDDALIGAGSVITSDVPKGALALGRARQVVKEGWVYRKRGMKK